MLFQKVSLNKTTQTYKFTQAWLVFSKKQKLQEVVNKRCRLCIFSVYVLNGKWCSSFSLYYRCGVGTLQVWRMYLRRRKMPKRNGNESVTNICLLDHSFTQSAVYDDQTGEEIIMIMMMIVIIISSRKKTDKSQIEMICSHCFCLHCLTITFLLI